MKYNGTNLQQVLEQHKLWLEDIAKGSKADFRYANLSNADLSNADLRYADLSNANLTYANLRSANLRYADLRRANLSYANLSNAILSTANSSNADLSNADLSNANLLNANIKDAYLWGANLSNANLMYTNLRNADLRGANLTGAKFRGTYLRRANLKGANLTGTILEYKSHEIKYIVPKGMDIIGSPVTTHYGNNQTTIFKVGDTVIYQKKSDVNWHGVVAIITKILPVEGQIKAEVQIDPRAEGCSRVGTVVTFYTEFDLAYLSLYNETITKKGNLKMMQSLKSYLNSNTNTIYTVLFVALVDHFVLGGALRDKLTALLSSQLDNVKSVGCGPKSKKA